MTIVILRYFAKFFKNVPTEAIMAKFTIVITTYNRLPLLRRAVESVLSQTVPCELVVADDCSTDGTQEYLKSLGDRIIYHRNPVNSGHAKTMNAGVAAATGEWVKALDDDDYLAPNCIETMTKAIGLRPQAVICSCQAIQVDENEQELFRTQPHGPGQAFYVPQEDIHYGMLLDQVPFGTPVQVAFKKEAFLKSGGWDSTFNLNYDDIDSWVKIAQYGDAIFINDCLAYRTLWPGGLNVKFPIQERLKTNILIKEKIYNLVNPLYQNQLDPLNSIKKYLALHWMLVSLKDGKFSDAIKVGATGLFSISGWQLLLKFIYNRKIKKQGKKIRQKVILS